MASPQTEDGYTRIANELLEHLLLPGITSSEYRVLFFVLRKTYGYGKKKDRIALSQFQKGMLMNRAQVVESIKSAVCKRILVKENGVYNVNKNWEEWVVCKRIPSMQTHTTASMQTHTKTSMQTHTHKRKKETITKEREGTYKPQGAEIIRALESVDPKNKTYYGNTTQREACDFLIENYTLQTVLDRIAVLTKTNGLPYFPTITSPIQLRDKWIQLQSAVQKKKTELSKPKRVVI